MIVNRCDRVIFSFHRSDFLFVPLLLVFSITLGLLFPPAEVSYKPTESSIILWIIFSLLSASIEELYFRYWLINSLVENGWKKAFALAFSVFLFSYFHIWQGYSAVIFSLIVAILYSLFFLTKQRIIPLLLAHCIHNCLAILL